MNIGVNPEIADNRAADGEPGDWKYCKWVGSWFLLGVVSTSRSIDEFESNENFDAVSTKAINDRPSFTYVLAADAQHENCSVALASATGTYLVRIYTKASTQKLTETCTSAIEAATDIEPHLPN